MDITYLILGIIAVIAGVIAIYAVPYLKEKLTLAQRRRIKEYIDVAVMAAEKLFPSVDMEKMGKQKLQYVADVLAEKGITFDVDNIHDEIRMMIESAVKQFCS